MPVKKKVLDFYNSKNLPLARVIERRPYNVTGSQVELAATQLYEEIKAGLEIRDINIARKIWEIAKDIDSHDYDVEMKILNNARVLLHNQKAKTMRYFIWTLILGTISGLLSLFNLYQAYWVELWRLF